MICVFMYVYMCICEYEHDITHTRSLKHPQPGRIATVNSMHLGLEGREGLMDLWETYWFTLVYNNFPIIFPSFSHHFGHFGFPESAR